MEQRTKKKHPKIYAFGIPCAHFLFVCFDLVRAHSKFFINHLLIVVFFRYFFAFRPQQTVFKRYGDVSSSIKLKVRLPITDMTDCKNAYTAYNVNLGQGQVCAGGMKAKDSCLGDSGKSYSLIHCFVVVAFVRILHGSFVSCFFPHHRM